MIEPGHFSNANHLGTAIAPEALRPRVEGDFANDRVKHDIMARLFGEPAEAARIGRFTVVRELGRGGTGVVYAAYDEQLERKIAVKLLHADNPDTDARARLMREAQAMARLSHPNIVTVHEVGDHDGEVFIAHAIDQCGELIGIALVMGDHQGEQHLLFVVDVRQQSVGQCIDCGAQGMQLGIVIAVHARHLGGERLHKWQHAPQLRVVLVDNVRNQLRRRQCGQPSIRYGSQ